MKSWKKTAWIVMLSAALGFGAVGWLDKNVLEPAGAANNRGALPGGVTTGAPPTPGRTTIARNGGGRRYTDGTYTGRRSYAYYGYVQVKAVISGGRINRVVTVMAPNHSGTSRYINGIACPYLENEAVTRQSGRTDLISGATLTSRAFRDSLGSALSQANL